MACKNSNSRLEIPLKSLFLRRQYISLTAKKQHVLDAWLELVHDLKQRIFVQVLATEGDS